VFAQIGMIMLVGLASKNAILIVEFAQQLRAKAGPLIDAAVEAATIRLRPILMTSFAFIFGVLPLVFASGSGAGSRHSLGTTVLGGMIASTFLNLAFIPVLYVVVEGWRERRKHGGAEAAHMRSSRDPTRRIPTSPAPMTRGPRRSASRPRVSGSHPSEFCVILECRKTHLTADAIQAAMHAI